MRKSIRKATSFLLAVLLIVSIASISPLSVSAADPTQKILGDVDRDGRISTRDATAILSYMVETMEFDKEQEYLANVDGDARISTRDATYILSYMVEALDMDKPNCSRIRSRVTGVSSTTS